MDDNKSDEPPEDTSSSSFSFGWWPYIFMVCSLVIFICVLIVACRRCCGKRIIRHPTQLDDVTERGRDGTHRPTEDRPITGQENERYQHNQPNRNTAVYYSGEGSVFPVTPRYGSDINGMMGLPRHGGVSTIPEVGGGSVLHGHVALPPYIEKPPSYDQLFPDENENDSPAIIENVTEGVAQDPVSSNQDENSNVGANIDSSQNTGEDERNAEHNNDINRSTHRRHQTPQQGEINEAFQRGDT